MENLVIKVHQEPKVSKVLKAVKDKKVNVDRLEKMEVMVNLVKSAFLVLKVNKDYQVNKVKSGHLVSLALTVISVLKENVVHQALLVNQLMHANWLSI